MKRKTLVICSLLSLSAVSTTALANAKTGLVLGGQIGYAEPNVDWKNVGSADVSKGNLYYGANLGYDFALMPNLSLGAEVGVFYSRNLSKISSSGDTDKVSNLIVPVLGTAKLYFLKGFDVFVKGGISYVDPSASKSGSSYTVDWKSDWNFTAAAGLGYNFDSIGVFAQYMHIFGKDDVTINGTQGTGYSSKIDAITLGLTYTF
ncbi:MULTISPECIES: outer membrane protein [Cysteiniphilum]|uniref:outer membrane protein n=1 Tax=Cysteiniphilum TaxID=2056696 RepID=UPI001786DE95|nr:MULTISPECIES: outer membrane beta-barrel protein [Cysteiniphilum]